MFVVSLFAWPVKFKDTGLPVLNNKGRKMLRYCGVGLLVISASLYAAGIASFVSIGKDFPMMLSTFH